MTRRGSSPSTLALIEAMQRRDSAPRPHHQGAHRADRKRVLPALKRNAVIVDGREA
jgi:hypothetical protein